MSFTQFHRCTFCALLVMLVLAVNASAFQVQSNSVTSLSQRQRDQHPRTALHVAEQKPRWTELPRNRQAGPELAGFEINTGRLAMVGFVGLLGREIVSGQSFGEQLVHAVTATSGVNLPI